MYERILWAHDGGPQAAAALPHVIAIATAFESEVIVCTVVELDDGIGFTETRPAEGVVSNETLALAAAELQQAGLRRVRTLVMQGLPERAVADTALAEDVQLIVMGTHGRSGLARAVAGSVSGAVTRNTPGIPVLIVDPREDDEDDGDDRGTSEA